MRETIKQQTIPLGCIALFLCFLSTAALGATRRAEPLPVEAVLRVKYLSEYASVSFSPDGTWLAYAARENLRNVDITEAYERTGIPAYGSGADIYLSNLKTGEVKKLTEKGNNWLPTWSPDGRLLAFLSDRDGSGQARLWVWVARSDRMQMVSEKKIRGAQIGWLPDSSGMVVAVAPENAETTIEKGQDPVCTFTQTSSRRR